MFWLVIFTDGTTDIVLAIDRIFAGFTAQELHPNRPIQRIVTA